MRENPERNRSGKIQRPGPDSPGGPRILRNCDQCGDAFWPRVVDVNAGKGRHCSSSCSSKAFRRPKAGECQHCGLETRPKISGKPPKFCDVCRPFIREEHAAKRRKPRAPKKDVRTYIEINGERFTYVELASVTGKSLLTVRSQAQDARRLGLDPGREILRAKKLPGNPFGGRGRLLTHDGLTLSVRQWAKRIGISAAALAKRIARLPLERALVR